MRQRFVIWFVLPCLVLAWPSVPLVRASQWAAGPADPEPRVSAKTPRQRPRRKPHSRQVSPSSRATEGWPRISAAPGQPAAAPAEAAAPAAPAEKLDKYNDAHSNAMRKFKKGFISWPKLLLILVLILIWVKILRLDQSGHADLRLRLRQMEPDRVVSILGDPPVVRVSDSGRLREFLGRVRPLVRVLPGMLHSVCADAEQSGPASPKSIHGRLVPL